MRTKRFVIGTFLVVMVLTLTLQTAWAGKGNDLPSGKHYNLNIIAAKEKNVDPEEGVSKGRRIFVKTNGKTRILLREGPFEVLDYDGTDGTAKFQLPHPDPDETADDQPTYSEYSVYIRVRGKPGGEIKMVTMATDPTTGEEVASDYSVVEVRTTGKGTSKFKNVSKELLYIYCWVAIPGTDPIEYEYVRLPLFDERLDEYLWDVDTNDKFKIAQLRFYPVPTEIPPVEDPPPSDPPS